MVMGTVPEFNFEHLELMNTNIQFNTQKEVQLSLRMIDLLYLSVFGRLISSQKSTSHLLSCTGESTTPFGVRLYSQ